MGLPRVGDLVVFTWLDAYMNDEDVPTDYPVRTAGWVVNNEGGYVSIAAEELPSEDGYRAVTHVPVPLMVEWKGLA